MSAGSRAQGLLPALVALAQVAEEKTVRELVGIPLPLVPAVFAPLVADHDLADHASQQVM